MTMVRYEKKKRSDPDFSPSTPPHQAGIQLTSSCGPGMLIIPKLLYAEWDGFVAFHPAEHQEHPEDTVGIFK